MKAAVLGIALCLFACIPVATARTWTTSAATAEAERDIAADKIKFCVWGGYAPQLVGVPERYHRLVSRYPRVMVGQGCVVRDAALDQRQRAYAVAYNTRMLTYVLHERQ
jgi:hypothetical protein